MLNLRKFDKKCKIFYILLIHTLEDFNTDILKAFWMKIKVIAELTIKHNSALLNTFLDGLPIQRNADFTFMRSLSEKEMYCHHWPGLTWNRISVQSRFSPTLNINLPSMTLKSSVATNRVNFVFCCYCVYFIKCSILAA